MKNKTLSELGKIMEEAGVVYIFPHQNMDGDAAGSCAALASVLSDLGKECYIIPHDKKIPNNLMFLDDGSFSFDRKDLPDADLAISLDCSEKSRFPDVAEYFAKAPLRLSIDHHWIEGSDAEYYYSDPYAAATGEIIFDMIKECGWKLSAFAQEAIFAAIVTDTGSFQYSNTTAHTHKIVAELYEAGLNGTDICTHIYQNESFEKAKLKSHALLNADFFGGGRLAMAKIDQNVLRETGTELDDSHSIISNLRNISGVEMAALIKEDEHGRIFVSLRSKSFMDVKSVAMKFGGGGHIKAAGFSCEGVFEEVAKAVKNEMLKQLEIQTEDRQDS